MILWWLTLVITYFLCYVANYSAYPVKQDGKIEYRANKFFAFLATSILVLVAGLRRGIGDTYTYRSLFNALPDNFSEYFSTFKLGGDWGFDFLNMLIKLYIKDNSQWMIFIYAMITIVLIIMVFYKYSNAFELSVYLFITYGVYIVLMNGIRQYFASAILFAAFPLIYKKKWYIYLPLVIIVAQIHNSAYFFILLYFIVNAQAWGKATKFLIIVGVLLYITYPISGPIIVNLLGTTPYAGYETQLLSSGGGSNIIRTFITIVPLALSYMGRDILAKEEKYFNIVTNMSILGFVFMLLSNTYWIYARFNMYFSVYMILLLCWCIIYLFEGANKSLVYFSCIILFGIYYWYDMVEPYTSNYIRFFN